MLWYEIAGTALYYITFPIVKLLLLVFYVVQLVLSPVVYIARTLLQVLLVPYNIAAKFEAILYFIGCAILLGACSALLLHGIFRTFVLVFRLDRKQAPKDTPATGPDVKSYRLAREKKRRQAEKEQQEIEARARALAESPLLKEALHRMRKQRAEEGESSPNARQSGKQSLLDQTILEGSDEEDS